MAIQGAGGRRSYRDPSRSLRQYGVSYFAVSGVYALSLLCSGKRCTYIIFIANSPSSAKSRSQPQVITPAAYMYRMPSLASATPGWFGGHDAVS